MSNTIVSDNVKPFKTYSEQLDILKSRGLFVEDEEEALYQLEHINYYRLSAYSLTMRKKDPDSGEERFYPGSTFNQIIELYNFDAAFRKVLSSTVSIIEISLRSYLSYFHSQKYSPLGYLDHHYFSDPWKHAAWLNSISKDLNQRKDDLFVIHHKNQKDNVFPLWVITEVCTFGQLSMFYQNLLPSDRLEIAKQFYDIPSREYIENWIHCAAIVRNICAHEGRFYNRPLRLKSKLPPNLKDLKIQNDKAFSYVYVLYMLLPQRDRAAFIFSLKALFNLYPFALPIHLGFPDNWENIFNINT